MTHASAKMELDSTDNGGGYDLASVSCSGMGYISVLCAEEDAVSAAVLYAEEDDAVTAVSYLAIDDLYSD